MSASRTDFEKAFDAFLERSEYDQAENALFAIVRIAFLAGWKSAGGDPSKAQRYFNVLHLVDMPEDIETDIEFEE